MTKRKTAKKPSRARARLERLEAASGWGGPRPGAGRKKGPSAMPRAEQLALPAPPRKMVVVTDAMLERARVKPPRRGGPPAGFNPFAIGKPPPGVLPADAKGLAMDEASSQLGAWAAWGGAQVATLLYEGLTFPGYAYLSELAQRTEYRVCSETIATEMTRKWMKLKSVADDDEDKLDRIKQLEEELLRLRVQEVFRELAEHDGQMGVGHLYVDTGKGDDRAELLTSIGNGRDSASKMKVRKGDLKGLRTVEAMWCYPSKFNATDPLSPDWYKPTTWYTMAKEIHSTRLLTIIGRQVPDLLKPSYFFGGLSLSQLVKPYVDNWIRTRQSVSDLLHAFSVFVLETDLGTQLSPAGEDLFRRLDLFNVIRDNRGVMAINSGSEKLTNVSVPLGSLDALQAQSQEHIASAARIPLVKYTGIEPHGLNASSEGSIKTFDDVIAAYQTRLFDGPLRTVIGFAMLNLWGEIDEDIVHEWNPLRALDPKELAERQKSKAETGKILVETGIVSQEEERARVAKDPESGYDALVVDDVPDLAAEEEEGLEPEGGGGKAPPGGGGGPGKKPGPDDDGEGGGRDAALPFVGARDAAWREGDHPRGQPGNAGQFGPGGGQSPHHGTAGNFVSKGAGNLAAQGFKPRKRGSGSDLTQAMQVAWHVAQTTGKPQTLTFANTGIILLKKGESIPFGHPHVVVDPEGNVAKFESAPSYSAGVKAQGLEEAAVQKTAWRREAPATVEEVIAGAGKNQARLAEVCEQLAAASGAKFKNPGPKRPERIKEKLERGKTPQQVNDAVRGGFDARTPEEADAIVAGLAKHFEVADEGWAKTPTGYFDRKVMVRFDDGMIGEVQVWPPGMLAAKSGEGHAIYEEWQKLPADSPRKGEMQDRMVAVFAAVMTALPGAWQQVFS